MTAPAAIRHPDRFYIGGEWVRPSASSMIDVINSGTEERFATVAEAQEADVNAAVEAARTAFDRGPWPRMSHAERADYLRALATELNGRAEELAQIFTTESGVIHSTALDLSPAVGRAFEFYADLADTYPFVEEHAPTFGGNVGMIVREPVGVVAAIVPWNGPALCIAYKCGPALIAGCTIVVKSAPEAPLSALVLAEACEKIGLPPGVVNVITADRPVSELLVRHPGIDKVTFTGSTAAGRRIGAICGERMARCTLELGGKSAAIILDDFDIGQAAETIGSLAVFLTGQACSSLTRIIVSRNRHDAMVDALSAMFESIRVGDPFDLSTQMGPLAMKRQRDRVESYIALGTAEGAVLATGGKRPAHMDRGYFIEPTIFGNVDNHATIAREEIFGPVLSVIPADSEADAIAIANDTTYGLNSSVFTNDVERAYAVSREMRTGTVGHNCVRSDPGIGFGGFKQSGVGREGGIEGLAAYLEAKTVILDARPSILKAQSLGL